MQTQSTEEIVKTACRALVDARSSTHSDHAAEALSRISALLVLRTRLKERIARPTNSQAASAQLNVFLDEVETRLSIASERALELVRAGR